MSIEILQNHTYDSLSKKYRNAKPFPYLVIDDFFDLELAKQLELEFPDFTSDYWHSYNNKIEVKKTCNSWNQFTPLVYRVFEALNSVSMLSSLSELCPSLSEMSADSGLNGGGLHMHAKGGKLNTHLDYSLHPKLGLQRRLNLIVYLNSDWSENWGGSLGLWGNESSEKPGELKVTIKPLFNRCVIFDTTQNSWHGLPDPLTCPDHQYRKSMAVYYLSEPKPDASKREKAMFSPTKSQENDKSVLELIKLRSSALTAHKVWKDTK